MRPPLSFESGAVSELILQSDCGLLPALFGGDVAALLDRLQAAPANPYSADKTLVIVDEADAPIGALVGALASATRAEELRTASLFFSLYGLRAFARFPRLARVGRVLRELRPDDFYLSNIAVTPEHRGCGAGTALLSAGEASAARGGAGRIVLDVEEGNERARAFYGRSGYRFASRVAIDLGRRGSFRFLRLAKDLGVRT